jgi:hypothetical protein
VVDDVALQQVLFSGNMGFVVDEVPWLGYLLM